MQVYLKYVIELESYFIEGTSLAVQWLRLHTFTAGGMGSIPNQGTKILHSAQPNKFFF